MYAVFYLYPDSFLLAYRLIWAIYGLRMERAGIRADVRCFNAAINACAQARELSSTCLGAV